METPIDAKYQQMMDGVADYYAEFEDEDGWRYCVASDLYQTGERDEDGELITRTKYYPRRENEYGVREAGPGFNEEDAALAWLLAWDLRVFPGQKARGAAEVAWREIDPVYGSQAYQDSEYFIARREREDALFNEYRGQ